LFTKVFPLYSFYFICFKILFSAPFHESTESLPSNTIKKDLPSIKTASAGQREARELFVETYVFDGE
jgi:hypothetical protein